MRQVEMWKKMRRLLRHMFCQHDGGEFVPDTRERLKEELMEAKVNPDMIEAFEKAVYLDPWHEEEGIKPLDDTEKYLIAHLLIYKLFGEEEFREMAFLREAHAARLEPEEVQAIKKDNWPNWPLKA